MSTVIKPAKNVVLVKLPTSEYGDIPIPAKAHDSVTHGVIVEVSDTRMKGRIGHTAFWQKYKDDARVPGKDNLAFIKIEDILGYAYSDTADDNQQG